MFCKMFFAPGPSAKWLLSSLPHPSSGALPSSGAFLKQAPLMFDHNSFFWRIDKLFVCFNVAGASSIFQDIIWSQARLTTSNPGRHGLILMHHFILKPKMQSSQHCFGCLALNPSASLFSCLAVGYRRLWLAEKNRGLWLAAQNSLLTKSTTCGHATSPGLAAEHNCYLRDKTFQCRIVIRQW